MTTRHTISTAAKLYAGAVNYSAYNATREVGRPGVELAQLYWVDFGTPDTASVNGICDGVTCSTTAATSITLLVTAMDVPRCAQVNSTDSTQVDGVVTITGTDYHGAVMVEKITATGTTTAVGKKAFSGLTSISVAACTAAGTIDIGWVDKLGLPVRVDNKKYCINFACDGVPEAFTVVAADTDQDDTAADNRGTIDPNTACNDAKAFSCLVVIADNSTKEAVFGYDQYTG